MNLPSHVKLDKRVQELLAVETQVAQEAGALSYMARLLAQVTLPHSKPKVHEFERHNGLIALQMVSPSKVGLPYGHYPRLIMSWITREAVLTKSPVLELGDNLSSFMQALGLVPTGGRWGTVTRLREHIRRLLRCSISWTYELDSTWAEMAIHPIEKAQLWWDPKQPDQIDLWKSTLALNQRFYEEIVTRPVPVDMRVLKCLARERSPFAIDIYTWLTYRVSYLRKEVCIPWEALQLQFGGGYRRTRDFKRAFSQKLKLVLSLYPRVSATPTDAGLRLSRSRPHILPARFAKA